MRLAVLCALALPLVLASACSSSSPETLTAAGPPSADGTEPVPVADSGVSTAPEAKATAPATGSKGCGSSGALSKPGRLSDLEIAVGKSRRTYALTVPTGYDASRSYPLVFALHGSGGNGPGTRDYFGFESFAGDKAVFVYPSGENGSWELDTPASQNKDVAFFDALVAELGAKLCIDTTRIFATGYSNGAYMANQLGCRRGDVLRAIAPHAGGGPFENDGKYTSDGHLDCGQKPVAAMVFIGLADTGVDPSEGEKSLAHWTYADGCRAQTSAVAPGPCVAYQGCKKPVVSCKISGLGHEVWKEGAKATWSFFASF